MAGEVRTRRWNDSAAAGDGVRILVCRFRPRGVRKADETWDEWWREVGPTPPLLAAALGKGQEAIGWDEYRRRYLEEMSVDPARFHVRALAGRVAAGETLTLLCSSSCTDETRCHRSLLRDLIRPHI